MKSRNKKRLLALVLCMVVAISNSSFIFASETGQAEYPQEAEVQTQDEAVADDMDVAAYAADEGQAVAEEQPAAVEQVAAEPAAEPETTAVAPAEQPAAEAPAAEQPTTEAPAAETPAAQEPAAAPTEETAPAAENATAETPEEDATQAEAENQQLTWSQAVGNTTVNVTAEAGALPADAQLSVTEITAEDEVKEIEKAVEEKAIEEQFSIKNIFSYDIKFLVNGSEVQPTTPVQVSVDTPEITSSENAAVLHVDDNNVAEDMNGAVDGEGKVVFDAPHFSNYVIVQKGDSKVNVTIEYYDNTQNPKKMIYASKKELSPGESISNYDIADNWTINQEAEKSTANGSFERISISDLNEIKFVSDCTIKVYYTPKDETITGSTIFYDYTVKAGTKKIYLGPIDLGTKYYSFNQLINDKSSKGSEDSENEKLIAGTNDQNNGQNYPEYQKYRIYLPTRLPDGNVGPTKDANGYTGGDSTIPGLLKEIDDNGNVIFNYAEPGFFVNSDYAIDYEASGNDQTKRRYLRKVYKNYTLEFDRKGDTYTLNGVKNQDNGRFTGAGNNFYPLNDVKLPYEESETSNNYYFGMRYDVTFKIGDYVGPLNYEFTGDDDLWVVLDGKKIVIDLGGIHSAAKGTVDLWDYIGQAANLTEAQKQQNHTLTILYMERGAYESNCQMKFTLPSAKIQQVDKTKMTNISFYKTDAEGNALPGAQFSLMNDTTNATMLAASDSDGLVQFQQLVAGTYTLTETQAPKDYVTPTTSWKVKVTTDSSGGLSARIYLADGRTELGKLTSGGYRIINSASTPVQPPTPGIVETKKELSHEKYIAKNDDGTYNLTLNVSGAVGSESYANKLDVLFVMDTSNSMKWAMTYSGDNPYNYLSDYKTNSASRFYNQQKAVEDAVAKLKSKKNVDAKFAVVSFDTQAGIETKWTKDSIKYPTSVGNYKSNNWEAGGTNYQAGLRKADELLKKGRADVTKIVVFLSDGDPTLYYKTNRFGNEYVDGSGSGYDPDAMAKAQTQLGTMSMNYFYTVGVGPEDSYKHLSSLSNSAPSGTVKGSYNGTDSSNLKNAFDSIIRDATELLCTNVTVTDTLTDEVELVNNDLTVVVKDEAGNVIKKLKDSDGTKVDVSKIITTKIQTDANGKKQIIMRFKSNYKLESGYTYYVTAKIKPTDQAYLKYQENGYTDTGDEFTDEYLEADKKPQKDTRNDGTSSKQEGFKSNVSADVRYTYNGVTDTKSYKDPVIQVDNETVSHTVEKQWEDGLNKVAIQVELKAYVTEAVDKSVNAENPKYLIATEMKNLPAADAMQVTLSDTSGWNHTWENLPKYYFYKDGDTIKRTKVHYTVEEIASEATSGFYGKITESDDGTKTTILNKAKDVENQPFIEVTKTFEGLTNSQIEEMANPEKPYTITVTNVETGKSYSLTMDKDHLNEYLKGSETTWTYTWKLEGWSKGTYKVVESNYEKEGYEVSVTVDGKPIAEWNNITVSTKQTEMAYELSARANKCSSKTFKIGKVNLIVAQLTSNEGYFVWTSEEISVNERLAIIALINAKDKIEFSPTATLTNSYFYSGTGIENTLVFRNGEIKYDGKQNLQFDASKQWTMFEAGTYTLTNAHNAEITVKNTYEEKTVDLDLVKTSVAGTKFDGAEFKLYKKNDNGAYELQKFEYTDGSGNNQTRETIQVINTDGSEAELKNLQSGQYYLEEVKAPEACMLLADKIYFKQEKGKITLTDNTGKVLADSPTMWELLDTDGKYRLIVKNEIIYDLPSTGHSGIFNIMMSGILLMFAGILIIYKMKGKEVLKK